jgi:alpha-L-fucosidase
MRTRVFVTIAALLLATLGFPAPARADLLNPRQTWLRNSTAGLFLHWGMRTNPGYTSCSAWESAITNGGWNANYWVQEAQKLHVQYLVLASFHSRLGYGRPWPSRIPGSCSTRRDFLGETIAAAKAKGLKVILYMTDDPQWFWEGLQPPGVPHDPTDMTQPSWFDSAAYSKFKGHPTNLNTRPGFGEFSYDNFFEVMRNYPDLAGFWIDNDNAYWEQHNLYQQIHQLRPDMLLSNNNEDTPEMDTVSNEQKTGMTPSYDYPQAVWTPQPRLTEADYKLPTSGSWWYDGSNSRVDYKLTLGRMITNVGSSIKALEAETAQVNGLFPTNQAAFNDFANGYLTPIWSSLSGVEGGGYMYGGLQPGAWNDGAYGVTTISRTNPNLHYIHAIDRPSGDSLRLRDNGYRVVGVSDLRTGTPFAFSQSGGVLTISGVTNWDQYDTVFKVVTAGRVGILSGVAGPSSLVDGSYLTWWDNKGVLPATVTLDLGAAKPVAYLGVNQREWSVSYARSSTEDSARIRDYAVETSLDGVTWTPAVAATMKSARGVQFIDLGVASARYVRLTVNSTWAAASATKYYKKLQIDEMWAASAYATPSPS